MTRRPTSAMRRRVITRARHRCEYCLIHQDDVASAHQVDHVVAEKHGGSTTLDNLALSCMTCNLHKGSDISSLDPRSGELVPLFNPRKHAWSEHLELVGTEIVGLTAEGRATSTLLKLNSDERRLERQGLIELGRFDSRDE